MLPIQTTDSQRGVVTAVRDPRVADPHQDETFADAMQREKDASNGDGSSYGDAKTQTSNAEAPKDKDDAATSGARALPDGKKRVGIGASPVLGNTLHATHAKPFADGDAVTTVAANVKHTKRGAAQKSVESASDAVDVGEGDVAADAGVCNAMAPTAQVTLAVGHEGSKIRDSKANDGDVASTNIAGVDAKSDATAQSPASAVATAVADDVVVRGATHAATDHEKAAVGSQAERLLVAGNTFAANMPGGGSFAARDVRSRVAVPDSSVSVGSKASAAVNGDLTVRSYEAPASNRLEIGVSGGSWGWLKVRAEMAQGGEVHAYLRGASFVAETELRSQTAGLQAYLNTQQVSVHGVHIEASKAQGWMSSMNTGSDGRHQQQDKGSETDRQVTRLPMPLGAAGTQVPWMPLPQSIGGAGGWLNVLA